ncbi:MAG: hypothetical protein KJ566_03735 [Nanoarchaeota archaeon]|nr:hypothetical protein [Nanoarchaeota archaeon]
MDELRYFGMTIIGSACKISSLYLVATNIIGNQQLIQEGNFKAGGPFGLSICLYGAGKLFHDFSTAYFHQLDNNFNTLEEKLEDNNKLLKKLNEK